MMKKITITLFLILAVAIAHAQNEKGSTITVTIGNVPNDQGAVLASLHTTETFMKGAGIANLSQKSEPGEVTLAFENVAPGEYALMVMQDANGNMRLDFDLNGIPTEPYANSGEMNLYGPPTFDTSKFTVNGEDVSIRLRF